MNYLEKRNRAPKSAAMHSAALQIAYRDGLHDGAVYALDDAKHASISLLMRVGGGVMAREATEGNTWRDSPPTYDTDNAYMEGYDMAEDEVWVHAMQAITVDEGDNQ